jgi:hypothetical protein
MMKADAAPGLGGQCLSSHAPAVFAITEAEAAAIRAVYEQRGEPSRGGGIGAQRLPTGPQVSGTGGQSLFRAKWHDSVTGGGALPVIKSGSWCQIDEGCPQSVYSTAPPGRTRIHLQSSHRRGAPLIVALTRERPRSCWPAPAGRSRRLLQNSETALVQRHVGREGLLKVDAASIANHAPVGTRIVLPFWSCNCSRSRAKARSRTRYSALVSGRCLPEANDHARCAFGNWRRR